MSDKFNLSVLETETEQQATQYDLSVLGPDAGPAIQGALDVNPDTHAKTLNMAKEASLPVSLVEEQPEAVDRELRGANLRRKLRGSTFSENWYSEQDNAKVAHDDVDALTQIENIGRAFGEGVVDTPGMTLRGLGDVYDAAARSINRPIFEALEAIGAQDVIDILHQPIPWWLNPSDILRKPGELIGKGAEAIAPDDKDRNFATDVAGGLGQLTAQITAAILTGGGSSAVMLTGQGAEIQSEMVDEAGQAGTPEADTAILAGGAITALTEKFGLDMLLKRIPEKARNKITQSLMSAGSEASQEVLEGVLQRITALGLYNPNIDIFEGIEQEASVAGTVGGIAGLILPGKTVRTAKHKADVMRNVDAVESKLEKRSPEKLAEFKAKLLSEQGVDAVSIPAEQAFALAQEDMDIAAMFELGSDDFQAALQTGGDVELSPVDYYSIPTESRERMIDHLRFGDEAMTANEAQTFEEEGVQQELEDLTAGIVPENVASETDERFVLRDMERKLSEAGVDPSAAVMEAQRLKTRAERSGRDDVTARSLYDRDNLQIFGPETPKPNVDELSLLLDRARSGDATEILGLSKTPMIDTLKGVGGVKPGSTLAAELNAIGVTTRTHPGLFRFSGIGAADTLVQSEVDMFDAQESNETGYIAPEQVIDAVRSELAGEPVRSSEDQQRVDEFNSGVDGLAQFLESVGLDLDSSEAEIRASLNSDSLNQAEHVETEAFKSWAGTDKAVVESYEISDHKFNGDGPYVLKAYHGTTHEFSEFDATRGNKEGHFGAINYFTSDEGDASQNYAGEGPDLTSRIEQLAEQLDSEEEIGMDEARELARERLSGGEDKTLEVYVKTEKPFVVGGENQWMELFDSGDLRSQAIEQVAEENDVSVEEAEEDYEDEVYERQYELEAETESPVVNAIEQVASRYEEIDAGQIVAAIYDHGGEFTGDQLEDTLRNNEGSIYTQDPETGELSVGNFVAEVIQELGYDSIILKDARQRFPNMDMGGNTSHVHVFHPDRSNIKSVENEGTYEPNNPNIYKQGAKGTFEPGNNIIRLTKNADQSTFLHETGHKYLFDLKSDAAEFAESNPELAKDFATVTDWFGKEAASIKAEAISYASKAKDRASVTGLAAMSNKQVAEYVKQGNLTVQSLEQDGATSDNSPEAYLSRAMNEQWARGFEDYLRTGQAPSIALVEVFGKFKAWLVSIYSAIKSKVGKDILDVQFSPEVQAVMDRMLASDEEIELVRQQYNLKSFFSSAEDAGMTAKQFESYQRKVARSADEMKTRQLKKHLNQIERTKKEWWTDEREKIEATIKTEVEARPEYLALYGLVRGTLPSGAEIATGLRPNRLNPDAVLAVLGNRGSLLRLPKIGSKGVLATSKNEGSIHPDVAAGAYGYNSGEELLIALMNIEKIKTVIDRETDAAMKQEFGDMTVDGTAVEEALEAAHIDTQGEVLAAELLALSEGQSKLKPAFVRQWAKEQIGQRKVDDIRPAKFTSVERKSAKLAGRLLRKGDRVGAARAKFKQLMNYYMAKEAYNLRTEFDKNKKYLNKFNKKRATFKKTDADYVDRIKELLAAYQLGPRLSEGKILRLELAAFNEWIQAKESNDGAVLTIPQEILEVDQKTHYRDLKVDEFRTLVNAIKNLEAQGRLKKTAILNGETRIIDEIEAEILNRIDGLPTKTTEAAKAIRQDPSVKDQTVETFHSIDAALRKTEFLLEFMDGEKLGPAHQAIFQTVADAEVKKNDIVRAINVTFMEKLEALPKEIRKGLGRRVMIPELGREMTRGNLIMMALNTGTDSNLDKMLRGSKDDKGASWTEENVTQAAQRLSKEEWNFVKEVWDSFDSVYPQIQEIYRRENGVTPETIEGRVIETPHGTYTGKYFPMLYDPRRSGAGSEIAEKGALEAMQSTMVHASVFSGMTKARTNFAAPVLLDIEALPQQIVKMAHYVSHFEAVRFLNKLINRKRFETHVSEKLGTEYFKELKRWIGDIAADGAQDASQTKFSGMLQALRTNVTVAIMGFSYTTGSAQLLGYAQSIDALAQNGSYSPGQASLALAKGIKRYVGEKGVVDRVKSQSGEMRHRIDNIDRDISLAMKRLSGKKGAWKGLQRASLYHIAYIQFYGVDMPTWLASQEQGLKNGLSESSAVKYADNIVRSSQTAGGLKDLSAFQKSKAMTPFSMFYSFFNLLYNVQARAIGDTNFSKPKDVGKLAARAAVLLALPTAAESVLRAEWPEEDEDYASWLALKSFFYGVTSVPLLRDMVGLAEGYGYGITPISSIGDSIGRTMQKISRDYDEGAINPDTIGKFGETIGYTLGVPVLQARRLIKTLDKWLEGDDVTPIEFLRGPDRD